MELPKRKSPRIPGYHYAENNYYFITICTANKKCIFGRPSALNHFGKIAEECLLCIPGIYPHITIDHYVIMPNHIHILFALENCQKEKTGVSIVRIIGQYKMAVTKKIHKIKPDMEVWQRSFHDHIIRNQSGYEKIWQYIEKIRQSGKRIASIVTIARRRFREGHCPSHTKGCGYVFIYRQ